jgi:hypothetical protein
MIRIVIDAVLFSCMGVLLIGIGYVGATLIGY